MCESYIGLVFVEWMLGAMTRLEREVNE